MKTIQVQELVQQFQLEVLAGSNQLDRSIMKARVYRPGLEFVGYFDFFHSSIYRFWDVKKLHIYTV